MSLQAPKGVSEYVPPRSALFALAREAFTQSARRACYAGIETAVFEDTSLFVRFGLSLGEDTHADVLTLITSLRRAGVRADMAFGHRGLKGAMKAADRSGARFAVLIGAEEKKAATVRIKDLTDGNQQDVPASSATDWLLTQLAPGQQA